MRYPTIRYNYFSKLLHSIVFNKIRGKVLLVFQIGGLSVREKKELVLFLSKYGSIKLVPTCRVKKLKFLGDSPEFFSAIHGPLLFSMVNITSLDKTFYSSFKKLGFISFLSLIILNNGSFFYPSFISQLYNLNIQGSKLVLSLYKPFTSLLGLLSQTSKC